MDYDAKRYLTRDQIKLHKDEIMDIDLDLTLEKVKKFCAAYGLGEDYTRAFIEDSILKIETSRTVGFWFFKKVKHSTINWVRLDENNKPIRAMPFGEHKTLVYH